MILLYVSSNLNINWFRICGYVAPGLKHIRMEATVSFVTLKKWQFTAIQTSASNISELFLITYIYIIISNFTI